MGSAEAIVKIINTFIQEDKRSPGDYYWNTDDPLFEEFRENYEERFGVDEQVGVGRHEAIAILGSAAALDEAVEDVREVDRRREDAGIRPAPGGRSAAVRPLLCG